MGYKHYWGVKNPTKWSEIWPQLISDANLIIETLKDRAPLMDEKDNYHLPTIERGIHINGKDALEDFVLEEHEGQGFDFCKTARKEYDVMVATILIRAKMLAGDAFSFSSDGCWDEYEWKDALGVYLGLWPNENLSMKEIMEA
ncbi:hypothetical protein SBOR_0967 [Sclerotinia borealis F-4128]|uniref:Uncharacterized protein n=1 Tax=Sclerotinia borealis (strain F-4128) TaxID=1432307 RepID=W9CVU3_SCLBF|nr:hypothetical protein SBOR_0967 [Sclerotinia borealis F-4128]